MTPEFTTGSDFVLDKDLVIKDKHGNIRIRLDKDSGSIFVFDKDENIIFLWEVMGNNLRFGGHGHDGDLVIYSGDKENIKGNDPTFHLNSSTGVFLLGGGTKSGKLVATNTNNDQVILLDGDLGLLQIGGNGNKGELIIEDEATQKVLNFNSEFASLKVGGRKNEGDIQVLNNSGDVSIHLDGKTGGLRVLNEDGELSIHLDGKAGDIRMLNADFAEEFEVSDFENIDSGTVMSLDKHGNLCKSNIAYDTKVAGVISGAGKYKPGIILDSKKGIESRMPLTLTGKVYCKVDASYNEVKVGDLLTTSPTPGYAMKAGDPIKAFGAVIGKAMENLPNGQKMIPILVSLQ